MKLIIDIPDDWKEIYDKGQDMKLAHFIGFKITEGIPLDNVLNKIRDEIEAEMNDLYRQPSIDQRTLTIIHACQRHIAIIDKYTKGEGV